MDPLKKSLEFETTFGVYTVDSLIGEGGAGRVYGGVGPGGVPIALKVLSEDRVTTDKRRRFKNEISFLSRNRHKNIVTVLDHGIAQIRRHKAPFYVMPMYKCNLRKIMSEKIEPDAVLGLFGQILDGVEAAHLQGVVHRDLKPENILCDKESHELAIADFGIARFTEDIVSTSVKTKPGQRLANFQYAAPEQRVPGRGVGVPSDMYALGLILNEMFTGVVPQGTDYRLISSASEESGFLDDIVAKLIKQAPEDRPTSIARLKELIKRHRSEAVSLQRLRKLDSVVVAADAIDDPLAKEPPRLVGAEWDGQTLSLTMDRDVSMQWINALGQMRSYRSVVGKEPELFSFQGSQASISAREHEVQPIIDRFKEWLPNATSTLKNILEKEAQRNELQRTERLRREKEAEEQRLRVNRSIRI